MKTIHVLLAVLVGSASAFAGSHVESVVATYTIPVSHNPVRALETLSARFQRVVVSEREVGNCDPVAIEGNLDSCRTIAPYAYKLHVIVGRSQRRRSEFSVAV